MNEQPIQRVADGDEASAGEGGDSDSCPCISVTVDADDAEPPDPSWLGNRLSEAVRALGLDTVELSIAIVDDATMSRLHARHLDDPSTTDVLTFDLRDEPFEGVPEAGVFPPVDGELVLCLDEARRRSGERGHSTDRELLLYAVHGLLHLLGYDDRDAEAGSRMHEKEDELLEAIGVGRTYAG